MQIVGQVPSTAQNETARVYRFTPRKRVRIIRLHPPSKVVTFSFFARTVGGTDVLRVTMSSQYCTQTADFRIGEKWQRHILTLRNEISLDPIDVFMESQIALKRTSDIAVAFPQFEEEAFATSPIAPDCALPAGEIPRGEKGRTRDQDRVWLDKEQSGFATDTESATAVLVAQPYVKTDQILPGKFLPFISFWSSGSDLEISFGISGSHDSHFVIKESRGRTESFIDSNVIGGDQLYFLCMVFDRSEVSLIINGLIVAVHKILGPITFDRTYFGCTHRASGESLNGHIKYYVLYPTPLLYPRVLELYNELCPDIPKYTYEYMSRYFRYSLVSDSEIATVEDCLRDEEFSYFISQLQYIVPLIYEQFPPQRKFVEDEIRDWVWALVQGPGRRSERESYTRIGRTDVTLKYLPKDFETEKFYRIELKIWGREGYKEAPSQPLKYMTESERVGFFVMIDRRQSSNIADFENIVSSNQNFTCLSIREVPLVETDAKYFVSFHMDSRYRTARMMLNLYLHIPDESD